MKTNYRMAPNKSYVMHRGIMERAAQEVARQGINTRMSKDSDGDGVPNLYDCQPYNSRKQGLIHDVGKAILRKIPNRGAVGYVKRKATVRLAESENLYKIREEGRIKARQEAAEAYAVAYRKRKVAEATRQGQYSAGYSTRQAFSEFGKAISPMMGSNKAQIKPKTRRKTHKTRKKGKRK